MPFRYWKVLASNLDSVIAETILFNIQATSAPYLKPTAARAVIRNLEQTRDSRKRLLPREPANKTLHKARLMHSGIGVVEVPIG